jgi:hypothetical protein
MNETTTLGIGMTVMALARAAESCHPKRLFDDPFSRKLAPGLWQLLLLPGACQAILALAERRGPGAMGNLYCRMRAIDDALIAALEERTEQVLILGAGSPVPGRRRLRPREPLPHARMVSVSAECATTPSSITRNCRAISTDLSQLCRERQKVPGTARARHLNGLKPC